MEGANNKGVDQTAPFVVHLQQNQVSLLQVQFYVLNFGKLFQIVDQCLSLTAEDFHANVFYRYLLKLLKQFNLRLEIKTFKQISRSSCVKKSMPLQ